MRDSALAQIDSPDEALVASSRNGDRRAFAELWRRHYRSGLTVARQFTNIDADDLVSESFARIYKRTVDGGGPTGAFRPYLYTTIRNLACTWGSQSRDIQVDEIDEIGSHESAEAPVARSLDRALTVSAYRSLPSRWQTVLWYTEVEGLDPQEIAPIMGLTSNAVAALAYRAREGLRKAWLQAHVNDATASGACQWVVTRLGEHSRHSLTEREEQRLTGHLAICAKCAIVSEEVDDVGARLAMVMIPLLLGGVAGGGLLASLGTAGAGAGVATASAIPALPASIGAAGASAGATTAVAGGGAGLLALAASAVIVAGAGAGIGLVTNPDRVDSAANGGSGSQAQAATGSATATTTGDADDEPGSGGNVSDAGDDLAISIPDSLLTPALPPGTTALPEGADDPDDLLGVIPDEPTLGGTVDKTLDGLDTTVDEVTDTVDKVTGSVGKVGETVDKVVDKVIPPKKGGKGSGVGEVVKDVTDTVDDVTGGVDDLVGGVTDGLGSGLGGLLGGGKKG